MRGEDSLGNLIDPAVWQEYFRDTASVHFLGYTRERMLTVATVRENWRVSNEVVGLVESLSPDVIHFDDLSLRTLGIIFRIKRHFPNTPLVLTLHDPNFHSGEKSRKGEIARKAVLRAFDTFILHSQFSKDLFCKKYGVSGDRVAVIPLGYLPILGVPGTEPAAEERANQVLFWGRLSPYKGVEDLGQAAAAIQKEIPEVKIIVAGRPENGYLPPDSIAGVPYVEKIFRYLPNRELVRLIQESTVVVAPYRDATQSGVILTAFAFGKPVVATHVGGIPEVVEPGKTGLLVPPGNPAALAEALIGILRDKGNRSRMKQAIQEKGEREFSWASIAQEMTRVYGEQ